MKRILIDECIDERLRHEFPGYDCQTARYAGLAGLKNGHLLEAAEAANFDVLITVDQNIPHQQNMTLRKIAILILKARTSRFTDLVLTIPDARTAIEVICPGEIVTASGR